MPYAPTFSGVSWSVADLLDEVRDEAAIPSSSRFTAAKILAFADQAIRSIMSEAVVSNLALAGRWLDYHDALISDGYRGGAAFLVPNAAASGAISHVDWYDSETARPRRLAVITAAQSIDVDTQGDPYGDGRPTHWYFHDGRVVLVPAPQAGVQPTSRIRIWFPRIHPKLVETGESPAINVTTVSSISTAANEITLQTSTANLAWPIAPFAVDLYARDSPHTPLFSRLQISGVAGPVLTYVEPIVGESDLDGATTTTRIAPANTSDRVQLPDSYRKALTSRTASYILRTIGDETRANSLWGASREDLDSVQNQLQPRAKASRVVMVNRHSALRRRRSRWWRGW